MSSISLINLETRAARIAASLDARPHVGAIWRRIVALSEAAASLGLEDIGVKESDIARPAMHMGIVQGEPQSVTIARGIHRALLNPPSIARDPGAAFDRIFTTSYMSQLLEGDSGPRVDYPVGYEVEDWVRARDAFALAAPKLLNHPAPITLRALAVAQLAAGLAPQRYPMAERLLFSASESEMRKDLVLSDPIISRSIEGLDRKVDASWVMLPSISLSRGGYRAWSPATHSGRTTVVDRMHHTLGAEAGRIGQVALWHERMLTKFHGKTKSSRRSDFSALVSQTPVINGSVVASALSVTERSARRLIEDATEMGLLKELTRRRVYQVWAVPALAEMIQERSTNRLEALSPGRDVSVKAGDTVRKSASSYDTDGFDQRVAKIMDDLDEAMANADRVLEKYKV